MGLYLTEENQGMLLNWAAAKVDLGGAWPDVAHALGVVERGSHILRGVLVTCETYSGVIDVHFASDGSRRWATKSIMQGLFGYTFIFRKAHRIQTIHSVGDKASTSLILRMGFTVEGTLKDAIGEGQDGLHFGMSRRDCPWIEAKDKEARDG